MNTGRYIAGIGFCGISAFLYAVNYVVVAAYASQLRDWNVPPGRIGTAAGQYSSSTLVVLSIVSLALGLAFLIRAEVGARRVRHEA